LQRRFAVLAAVALLLGIAGVAYASIPGPDGVIHGCYKTSNPAKGSLIVIDSEASCPSGFAPLNWQQQTVLPPRTPYNITRFNRNFPITQGRYGHILAEWKCEDAGAPAGSEILDAHAYVIAGNDVFYPAAVDLQDDGYVQFSFDMWTIPEDHTEGPYGFREQITCALFTP
jgi:hypothetical protein